MTATLFLFPGTLGVLVAYHLHKPHGPSCSKQGLHRSWKTWEVMEFKNFIFQAWKVMEFNCWAWKVIKIKLLQMTKQG